MFKELRDKWSSEKFFTVLLKKAFNCLSHIIRSEIIVKIQQVCFEPDLILTFIPDDFSDFWSDFWALAEISGFLSGFTKDWELHFVRGRRIDETKAEESFSKFDFTFKQDEPAERIEGFDDLLIFIFSFLGTIIEIVADISEHDIHGGIGNFVLSDHVVKRGLSVFIQEE